MIWHQNIQGGNMMIELVMTRDQSSQNMMIELVGKKLFSVWLYKIILARITHFIELYPRIKLVPFPFTPIINTVSNKCSFCSKLKHYY